MAKTSRKFYRIIDKNGKEWLSRSLFRNYRKVPWSKEALELLLAKTPETASSEFVVFDEKKYRRYVVSREWLANLPADKLLAAAVAGHL